MATIGHTMPQPMTTISHLLFIRYGLVCLLGCSSSLAGFLGIEFSMRTEAPRPNQGENRSRSVRTPSIGGSLRGVWS